MNKNPFEIFAQPATEKVKKTGINLYSSTTDFGMTDIKNIKKVSTKEKAEQLFNALTKKFNAIKDDAISKFGNPILSETQKATTMLLAEKKNLLGERNSEIYQLLNLLSNKKPYVALKAASLLEQKIINPDTREIVKRYFTFNPEAKVNYAHLYNSLQKIENDLTNK